MGDEQLEEMFGGYSNIIHDGYSKVSFFDDRKVSELTVGELKNIIRDIVGNMFPVQPVYIPPQPYPPMTPMYKGYDVYCDNKTEDIKKEIL